MAVQGYLNKSLTKLIFGQDASLNVSANDLGEGTIKMAYDDEGVKRLNTCVGQVVSLNFFRPVTITISINKVKNAYQVYSNLIESGIAYIGGNCTFINDIGREFTIEDLSIEKGEDNGDGENASVEFTLKGTQKCNQGAFEI